MAGDPDESQRITAEILKEALANKLQAHPNDVEIKDFHVSDGIKKGENFSCIMKAVTVNSVIRGMENKSEFMTKVMPMNQWRQKWLQEVGKIEKKHLIGQFLYRPGNLLQIIHFHFRRCFSGMR
jgi:hypothetical protein